MIACYRLGAVLGLAALTGCGPKLVPVTGTLTKGADPIPNVIVQFSPVDPRSGGMEAYNQTDGQGRFTLRTLTRGPGVVPGEYKVLLQPPDFGPGVKLVPGHLRDISATPWRVTVPATGITDLRLDVDHDAVP